MSIVRVKSDVRAVVYDHNVGAHVALVPGAEYEHTDPLVKANMWAFQSDADAKIPARKRPESARIEQATAAPGESRNVTPPAA